MAKKNNILTIKNIKSDFELLKQKKLTNHNEATNNIGRFISICKDKYGIDLSDILKEIFENETVTDLNLTWHYGEHFVVNFFWNYKKGILRNEKLELKYRQNT